MSTVVILTPIIVANWPVIIGAAAGAASAMGLLAKETVAEANSNIESMNQANSVEVQIENSSVMQENIASDKELVFTKENVTIRVKRDARGACTVCAEGKGKTKAELKMIAEEFNQKFTQCYVYNKVVSELKDKHFQVVNEEVLEDETVRINVRRWVD